MYKEHPICIKPDENAKIWRFLDFTKFFSLVSRKRLHFARTDQLNDRFEGSIPRSSHQMRFKRSFDHLKGTVPENIIEELQKQPPLLDEVRRMIYICSFHMSEHENAALWKTYLKSNEGVAFQTTVKQLIKAFNASDTYEVHLSRVKYIDYSRDSRETIPLENALYPVLHKRKSFEYENELRAFVAFPKDLFPEKKEPGTKIYLSPDDSPKGIFVPVGLESLFINIYVAPTSDNWFKDLVQSVIDMFDIKLEVHQSSLDEEPLF